MAALSALRCVRQRRGARAQQEEALRMATELGYLLDPQPEGIRVMGPAEAPVLRVKNEFRYQILLKAARRTILRDVLNNCGPSLRKKNGTRPRL